MDLDIEFYTEILEDYSDNCNNETDVLLWMCYSIIKLLKITKDNRKTDLVRNGLILILEHYQCFEEHLLDMSYLDSNDLLNNDKDFFLSALKEEFA